MGRYSDTNILKNRKPNQSPGPRYYQGTKYPEIPLDFSDIYVYAEQGDRYDQLALQYYGDPSLWWVISTANSSLSKNSYFPPLGVQIRIPKNIGAIQLAFEKLNNG
jgi:phage tail protein X